LERIPDWRAFIVEGIKNIEILDAVKSA